MRTVKRSICGLLAMLMLASVMLVTPAYAVEPDELIMDMDDSATIISMYPDEIVAVEAIIGETIQIVDREVVETLKTMITEQAINGKYSGLQLSSLMNDISLALNEWKTYLDNRTRGSYINVQRTQVLSNQYLRGDYKTVLSVGESVSYGNAFNLSTGVNVKGFEIARFTLDWTKTTSFSGPSVGETLSDGKNATHHIAFNALQGSLYRYTAEYIDEYGTITPVSYYYIDEDTAQSIPMTAFASVKSTGEVYVENASRSNIRLYQNWNGIISGIESSSVQLFI